MINGSYNKIYIEFDGEYLPIGMLTGNSFTESTDELDSTTRDNNGWKTQVQTNQSYSIEFSGIVINTAFNKGDFTKISYDRLKQMKRNKEIINWKEQDDNLQFIESGQAQITSLTKDSNIDEFISFTASLKGYGEPSSTSGIFHNLQDGNENLVEDGNTNEIIV